ncbi:tRNA pseudouridine(55) synthase TruB [[Haemophilus] ducreyi]|uniref:tRNA pseudouridine(55) synthase TruB n=1 Tax=Haemophilus ducreyi TaxID=730 RepID=UPI000654BE5F|nr:tRNA pseudouridine(55) synthase TruB [[Haemophilus] ducreyi]AKO45642.1 pseudouridine synthase [[Haemophilus] ducreyi]AKO47027.1 pseudouridine synthase [[Haemophilus] ducreyi]AKO48373.1 pseudouridine synthase [[Haemophilus] ducreyi]AKO49758.1 pseudouridine synthase [[Haemophilus] ducreyi]ANF67441.1 tRNA pseudouridine(55) synthase TruB [[Haemophilus] ducreyi]
MARPKKKGRDIHGVFLLDKPQGMSSNEVLQKVKRFYQANKAGHTGALDPLATGMLPICLGEATKFSQFLLDSDKRYIVTTKLGERTDTSDAEGELVESREVSLTEKDILAILPQFTGDLLQVPTMFSALKHQGKPLYEYARQGITIEREARPITIFELKFISYEAPYLTLDVHCSKGTYIRTLIDDLGEKLGCGAHVAILRRLAVADYPVDAMMNYASLQHLSETEALEVLDGYLLPVDTAVRRFPKIRLTTMQTKAIGFGQRVKFDNLAQIYGMVRLYSEAELFLGIAEITTDNVIRPNRMVNL